jgi:hypothetical protein
MDKPTHTKTTVLPWGSFYLMCSFIAFLALILVGLNAWQKPNSEGLVDIAIAVGVLFQGLMVFSIAKALDATNRMCAYLVELAQRDEKENASGSYKDPWSCPICQQQNSYWDEKCVKCGHAR